MALLFWQRTCCKENCAACLVDSDIRQGVGRYLLQWGEKDSHDRKTIIAEWYRYANPSGFKNKKQTYKLSYDASGLGEMACHQFANVTLCLSGLHTIFDLGQRKWESIKKVANTLECLPFTRVEGSLEIGISEKKPCCMCPLQSLFGIGRFK